LLERREKLREETRGFAGERELPRGMDEAIIDVGMKIEAIQRDIKRLQILTRLNEGDTNEEVKDQVGAGERALSWCRVLTNVRWWGDIFVGFRVACRHCSREGQLFRG